MGESEKTNVGIFGGSFNPPHVGHVLAVALAFTQFEVGRVVVIPTFRHPFAKELVDYNDRIAMCERAMGWLPRVEISRIEEQLGGESRTLRTLEHLQDAHPDWSLRLIMGADLLAESSKWFGFERIAELAPPIVLGRVGVALSDMPPPVLPSISSTEVRAMLARGDVEAASAFVPRAVLAYIQEHALYTERAR